MTGSLRTPFSIIATLSARRAVERRCVINMTVFRLLPDGGWEIFVIVSKIWFCACASREEVYVECQRLKKSSGKRTRTGSSNKSKSTLGSFALMKARARAIRCHWKKNNLFGRRLNTLLDASLPPHQIIHVVARDHIYSPDTKWIRNQDFRAAFSAHQATKPRGYWLRQDGLPYRSQACNPSCQRCPIQHFPSLKS